MFDRRDYLKKPFDIHNIPRGTHPCDYHKDRHMDSHKDFVHEWTNPPSPMAVETTKVAELKDVAGNLRYRIVLTDNNTLVDEEELLHKSFEVDVINYFYGSDPVVVAHRPLVGEPKLFDYRRALEIYNGYVCKYTNLIKAETRDIQDINVYKAQINYQRADVKCCAHCTHCKRLHDPHHHTVGVTEKHVCTHPNVLKFNPNDFCDVHFVDKFGIHSVKAKEFLELCPRVDLDGVCDNFEKSIKHVHDVDGMSLIDIIYKKMNKKYDAFLSNLSSALSIGLDNNTLSSQIESMVNDAVSKISSDFDPYANQTIIFNDLNDKLTQQITNMKESVVCEVGKVIERQLADGLIIDDTDSGI